MPKHAVCVFCSASNNLEPLYYEAARALGEAFVQNDWALLYGGTVQGMMREIARPVKAAHGTTIGAIPRKLMEWGQADNEITHLELVETISERKEWLRRHADAFIAMPGGWGTLEEVSEVIVQNELRYQNKPVIIYNLNHHFDHLLQFFAEADENMFISRAYDGTYVVVDNLEDLLRELTSRLSE